MRPRILIVEDDPALLAILEASLSFGDFDFCSVQQGLKAVDLIRTEPFDAILMDLGLPDIEGTDLLLSLRGITDLPIIVVSGRTTEQDKIQALDMGADDFVPKPFLPGELLARIRAVLRRHSLTNPTGRAARHGLPTRLGRLIIDPRDRTVRLDDHRISLTDSEFTILATLAANPSAPVHRSSLLEALYGPDNFRDSKKTVDVHLGRIRQKLLALTHGVQLIENRRGNGWILRPLD